MGQLETWKQEANNNTMKNLALVLALLISASVLVMGGPGPKDDDVDNILDLVDENPLDTFQWMKNWMKELDAEPKTLGCDVFRKFACKVWCAPVACSGCC